LTLLVGALIATADAPLVLRLCYAQSRVAMLLAYLAAALSQQPQATYQRTQVL